MRWESDLYALQERYDVARRPVVERQVVGQFVIPPSERLIAEDRGDGHADGDADRAEDRVHAHHLARFGKSGELPPNGSALSPP